MQLTDASDSTSEERFLRVRDILEILWRKQSHIAGLAYGGLQRGNFHGHDKVMHPESPAFWPIYNDVPWEAILGRWW